MDVLETTDTWQFNLPLAAGTGLFTWLIRPADLRPRLVWGTHLGVGALGFAGGALLDLTPEEERVPGAVDQRTAANRAGWGAAGGLVTAGISIAGVWADGAIERSLARRGVRRPRLWMGVGAAALSLATWGAERRMNSENVARPELDADPRADGAR